MCETGCSTLVHNTQFGKKYLFQLVIFSLSHPLLHVYARIHWFFFFFLVALSLFGACAFGVDVVRIWFCVFPFVLLLCLLLLPMLLLFLLPFYQQCLFLFVCVSHDHDCFLFCFCCVSSSFQYYFGKSKMRKCIVCMSILKSILMLPPMLL